MNNKILKLAEQVDIIKRANRIIAGPDYTISEHQLKTFAELIIKECAELVNHILKEGGGTQGDVIKEHFGIDDRTYYEIQDYEPIVERDDQGNVVSIINCPYIPKFFIEGVE